MRGISFMHRVGIYIPSSSSSSSGADEIEGGGHANPSGFFDCFWFFSLLSGHSKPVATRIKKPVFDRRFFLSFSSYNTSRRVSLSLSLSLYIYTLASDGKLISYTHVYIYITYGLMDGRVKEGWLAKSGNDRDVYFLCIHIHKERKRERKTHDGCAYHWRWWREVTTGERGQGQCSVKPVVVPQQNNSNNKKNTYISKIYAPLARQKLNRNLFI